MLDNNRRIRIGIDVGGTFTHAVAIDTGDFSVLATTKVPTSHRDPRGVASGIVESLFKLLELGGIAPAEIVMIAHSTTQATNALLEGDVAPVGIVGMAAGLGRSRARNQTRIGDIELAPGRYLKTYHQFIDLSRGMPEGQPAAAVQQLLAEGAEVIVASAAFSVEDPQFEEHVAEYCRAKGIQVTTGCEISQLYGLRARTRTAVINASMLPKMLETANMTESSVKDAGIDSPLMIMRSDGGIMDIGQMRKRPILTMLSGPAAGVAAAMMYARITDGIFLEVGGTSTDISAIRNGKSLVKSAMVGGHRLYLRTLDVRTLGIAGGSVPRVNSSRVVAAGPRSAHIAHVNYSAFEEGLATEQLQVSLFQPRDEDPPDYVRMTAPGREPFTVTPTCASNMLGLVAEGDNSAGCNKSVEAAFNALAAHLGRTDATGVANEMLVNGTRGVVDTVNDMIEDYDLDPQLLTLTGGGGGASAIVPFVARQMNLPYEIADNAAVISAIGAALALVRDTVERTVINPTEADIMKIRHEAEESVGRMGANAASIEVQIEIDAQKNVVRATATGTTELRTRDLKIAACTTDELEQRVRQSVRGVVQSVQQVADTGSLRVYEAVTLTPRLAGLFRQKHRQFRVIDREGIIRLQLRNGICFPGSRRELLTGLKDFFEQNTTYGDAGKEHPDLFVVCRGRIIDMSGLINIEQILALLQIELASVADPEPTAAIFRR